MNTSNLTVEQLNFMYQHGDHLLKSLATTRLSAIQMQQFSKEHSHTMMNTIQAVTDIYDTAHTYMERAYKAEQRVKELEAELATLRSTTQ